MLKTALTVLLTLSLAIGGGAASVWYVLAGQSGTGALTIGSWTAFPKIGAPDADPYSKARVRAKASSRWAPPKASPLPRWGFDRPAAQAGVQLSN